MQVSFAMHWVMVVTDSYTEGRFWYAYNTSEVHGLCTIQKFKKRLIFTTISVPKKRHRATQRLHHWGTGGRRPQVHTQHADPRTNEQRFSLRLT